MDDKTDNILPEDNGDESFDYEDLISDFSAENSGKGEERNLEEIDLNDLLNSEKTSAESADQYVGKDEDDITNIFNDLDELARDSVTENNDGEAEDADEKTEPTPEPESEEYDFGEITLDEDFESDTSDYASILSQIEGGEQDTGDTDKEIKINIGNIEEDEEMLSGSDAPEKEFTLDFDLSDEGGIDTAEPENIPFSAEPTDDDETDVSVEELTEDTDTEIDTSFVLTKDIEAEIDTSFDDTELDVAETVEETGIELSVSDAPEPEAVEFDFSDEAGDTEESEVVLSDTDESEVVLSDTDESGAVLSDTEAVEGVITGEFSMDDVDLNIAEEISADVDISAAVTGQYPALEDDAIPPDSVPTDQAAAIPETEIDLNAPTGEFDSLNEDTSVKSAYSEVLAEIGDDENIADSDETFSLEEDNLTGDFEIEDAKDEKSEHSETSEYADALSGFGEDVEEVEEDETEDELDFESDFTGDDLFADEEDVEEETSSVAPAPSVETSDDDGDDFLGLGGLSDGGSESFDRFVGTTEVLFEGVEMDFDEQIGKVTLAEVLLAQGKTDEAESLFREVESAKGVTSWVAQRLNSMGGYPAQDQTNGDEGEIELLDQT